jgi:hypothetical protein
VPIVSGVAGNSPFDVAVTLNVIPPPTPGRLSVLTEPAGATSNVAFTTQPVIEFLDSLGAILVGATVPVTASLFSGNGALVGSVMATPVNGVATFTDLSVRGIQTGGDTLGFGAHRIEFTAPFSTSDTSASFDVAVSFSYNVNYLFGLDLGGPTCLACHSGFNTPGALVNQMPVLVDSMVCPVALVTPSNSGTSLLMQKMDNVQGGTCGNFMPFAGIFAQSLRDMVRTWINEGAANN